ncbi:cytochrome c [Neisseria sp. 83E34]|uniref:c-type cytochrome n=1 Tax=Neisseria sp. 83E34 TaxID=1692264 RepID=UPI0006CE7AA1|nr:c-type cytochrome [Neisseria sp. 83E34]KPN71121.1 cytochrome C [Neisseria sp. 83E34]
MKRITLLALSVLACGVTAAPKADVAKGKEIAATLCSSCHATDGNSGIATYPRLAAQMPNYIEKHARDIRDGKRTWGNAEQMRVSPGISTLTDEQIRDVAAFFATQYPKAGEVHPKENPELGAKLFRGGLAEKGIPACMSCHGPNGAGMPAGGTDTLAFPRIGGQHKEYVVEQLKAYQSGVRKNAMMEDIAKRLSAEEMNAVGNFIQGLH